MAIAKMTQPTIRLELLKQKVHRQIAKAYEKTNYIMFSLTTVVCPGPFNARTILVTGDYLPQVEREKTRSNQVLTS